MTQFSTITSTCTLQFTRYWVIYKFNHGWYRSRQQKPSCIFTCKHFKVMRGIKVKIVHLFTKESCQQGKMQIPVIIHRSQRFFLKKIQTAERGKEGGLLRRVNRESFCLSCLSSHGKKNFTKNLWNQDSQHRSCICKCNVCQVHYTKRTGTKRSKTCL